MTELLTSGTIDDEEHGVLDPLMERMYYSLIIIQ